MIYQTSTLPSSSASLFNHRQYIVFLFCFVNFKTNVASMASASSLALGSLAIFGLAMALGTLSSQAEGRAFFVFGDSLVDNGNNNYLATTARADSPPYGIDYPTRRPTGRFSNGFNIPDFISWVFFQSCFSLYTYLFYLFIKLT